jgi:recombination protein RecA
MAKKKAIPKTVEELSLLMENTYGDALTELGDGVADVETIPIGIHSMDLATGVGGLPRGRIIEIYGPESSGKTTIALKAIASVQQLAGKMPRTTGKNKEDVRPILGRCGFLDVEHAFDPSLAQMHGVQMGKGSNFYFDQPMGGDECLDKLKMMVETNLFDMIVVDSVAGLTTLDEREKSAGDKVIAGTASLMSASLKSLVSVVNKSRTVVIFINQERDKPAVLYGSPITTTGGRALKFYASMRIRVSKRESITKGTHKIGHIVKVVFNKNKVAPPYTDAEIPLYYVDTDTKQAGFDIWEDTITTAIETGVIQLKGSTYMIVNPETGEVWKKQGKVKLIQFLSENTDVYDMVVNLLMEEKSDDEISEPEK